MVTVFVLDEQRERFSSGWGNYPQGSGTRPTMLKAADVAMHRIPTLRRGFHRVFYNYLSRLDRGGKVLLMNYGYAELDPHAAVMPMEAQDEPDRLCLQLYHRVAGSLDVQGKDVLEVGSGRGGGASYVKRVLGPASVTGVDYSIEAVRFCQEHYQLDGLRYVHGDAEDLPFEEGSFDAVYNIESSHCYGNMRTFLGEVHRVLRPGGQVSWADFRTPGAMEGLRGIMREGGFAILRDEPITPQVKASMARQQSRNQALIQQLVPRFAHGVFRNFAGVEGTLVYERFASGEWQYMHLVLRKRVSAEAL
jgi:ubiquinone/menaquinone biosynthesis C-methylase UbiE